jgi:Mrp family chromosome partitioning ATPase
MKTLLAEARAAANVVILDTTGLLDEGDAVELLTRVDAVVVVARAGPRKGAAPSSMGEMLYRLRAPSPGVVVNGQTESTPGLVEPIREPEPVVELR